MRNTIVARSRALVLLGCAIVVLMAALFSWMHENRVRSELALERVRALRLCDDHKELDALPSLEKLAAANPRDGAIGEGLARALVAKSATLTKEDESKAALLRARDLLLHLQKAKILSDAGKVLLALIPAESQRTRPSEESEIDALLREGESSFARRDFVTACAVYEHAYALDPTSYNAAIFAGDSHFARGQLDEACTWFARAASIDPNQATAFRFWGDALVRQGKSVEARDKYFDGVIADPYSRASWLSLRQWGERNHLALVHPRVLPRDPPNGQTPKRLASDGTIYVALYEGTRSAWKRNRFQDQLPDEKIYRRTLREESEGLRAVATAVTSDVESGVIKKLDPTLEMLVRLDEEGLLDAYIVLVRADGGIAKDYPAYREKHRNTLVRYLSKYVAPIKTGHTE
jgi:tetratricopeptide (TPR) repeat protein